MSPSAEPLQPPFRVEREAHGGILIRRVLKRAGIPNEPISAVVEIDNPQLMPLRSAFIDATGGRPAQTRFGATAFHALWCHDEPNAFVGFEGEDDEGPIVQHRISPGDSVYVPAGCPFALGPGILGYEVTSIAAAGSSPSSRAASVPTHGLERFEGYNRRTVCAAGPDLVLERWKVTQPLPLHWPMDRALLVTNLVEPMAIVWHGGSDLIDRAESRLLPAGLQSCTFIPDGLGYLLVSYVPDLLTDVIVPLREAGYSDSAIATLGNLDAAL